MAETAAPQHAAPLDDESPLDPPPRLIELFWVFALIGVMSFGGALSTWILRECAIKRRWLTEMDLLSGLALAQVMPGINVVNLSLYVGQRVRGASGALSSVMGMLTPPFFIIIALSTLYDQFAHVSWLPHFMNGIAAAAGGLLINMGVKAMRAIYKRLPLLLVITAAIFIGVGILHWHMVPVVLVLGPVSILLSWHALSKQMAAASNTKAS